MYIGLELGLVLRYSIIAPTRYTHRFRVRVTVSVLIRNDTNENRGMKGAGSCVFVMCMGEKEMKISTSNNKTSVVSPKPIYLSIVCVTPPCRPSVRS